MSQIRSGLRQPPQMALTTGISSIMRDVIVALIPALGMSVYLFGPRTLGLVAVSVMTCVLSEYLYQRLMGKPITIRDGSACVTGLLLAMTLPVTAPYWAPVLGGTFAIVVVKQFYGGLGKNFMNPALAGRMLLSTFPMLMTSWTDALQRIPLFGSIDAITCATPMYYLHQGILPPHRLTQLLIGQQAGSLGEVSAFMLLLGGAHLLINRVISIRIPASFLGTVALLSYLFPQDGTPMRWMMVQLLSGGLVFGAIFMATDYTTTPVTPMGQIYFGIGCGLLTVLLRNYGSYPEGVGWAILTMNCGVWLLDRAGTPRRFGVKPFTAARQRLTQLGDSIKEIKLVRPSLPFSLSRPGGNLPGEAHLDQIRIFGKSALSLICLIAVVVLGLTGLRQITDLDTARGELVVQQALLEQVMPQATMRTETPYRSPSALSITAGYSESELVGYCVEVQSPGFGGPITMVVGINLNGQVTGVAVTSHSESLGKGAAAIQGDFLSRFAGMSGTIRISGDNAVDVVSGATDTCQAITDGVNQALAVIAGMNGEGDVSYVDSEL